LLKIITIWRQKVENGVRELAANCTWQGQVLHNLFTPSHWITF